ncbi:hypothetical protein [Mesorhizobium sp. B4-1-3]|uniref:hypothetical protein n=1 Tax=Mesorhizobium sp. B4-1-3 TaxID=2589889 RepID=UPI0015E2B122|nr:hypothetical protein [Mesorhizobium sp. B4-1-3]
MNRLMLCMGGKLPGERLMTTFALMPINPASKTKRLIHKLSRIQQTVPTGAWRVAAPW